MRNSRDLRILSWCSATRAGPTSPGTNSAMRYALGGSVRVEGDDIRLYARLTDRTKGSILWANSYDGSRKVRRLLDVEGDVARDVATALGQPYGTIFQTDAAQALQGPPEDWEAYACTLAYYSYRTILDQPTHASVKQCLERAVARFPGYAHRLGPSFAHLFRRAALPLSQRNDRTGTA